MTDTLNPVLMDTYRLMLQRPGIYLGSEADTYTNRRRLLWMAAEMAALQLANKEFAAGEIGDEPASLLSNFNDDPEKSEWVERQTRKFRRDAIKKEFWKTWPMGKTDENKSSPEEPMSFFKYVTIKEEEETPPGDDTASDTKQPLSFKEWEEMNESALIDAYDFSRPVSEDDEEEKNEDKDKAEFPLNIPGVRFKAVHGADVTLENPEDVYKPPVRVKLYLPEEAPLEGNFMNGLEDTARTLGTRSLKAQEKMLRSLLAPLEGLTGLDAIKTHIENAVRLALVTQKRAQAGLPVYPLGGHMVFLGNPGTGKTHVARLLAGILHKAGILKHGHLIEVDRAALTGEYIGWSESKTHLVCNAAQGGILFIDEAYALSESDHGRDFGYEAINVLNKRMEDDGNNFIVIAAGYKTPMDNFLRSNPGLRSRFQHEIAFRDYTSAEMADIFYDFCVQYEYVPDEGAKKKLAAVLQSIRGVARDRFGNARGVRTLFERTIAQQARRLTGSGKKITPRLLKQITAADIPASEVLHDDKLAYLPSQS